MVQLQHRPTATLLVDSICAFIHTRKRDPKNIEFITSCTFSNLCAVIAGLLTTICIDIIAKPCNFFHGSSHPFSSISHECSAAIAHTEWGKRRGDEEKCMATKCILEDRDLQHRSAKPRIFATKETSENSRFFSLHFIMIMRERTSFEFGPENQKINLFSWTAAWCSIYSDKKRVDMKCRHSKKSWA